MKKVLLLSAFLFTFVAVGSTPAAAEQKPEMIVEKMAIKLTRGVTNAVTSIAELPKQTILTGRDMGAVGYVIGPIKGVGMTLYRALIGVTETVFCMVPQPGYYDPMIDPEYVWQGWEPKRDTSQAIAEQK
ncbi:MAG: exosortase system-associated protein, TIGR04073 family [Desulfuromonadaceae bacterium]|nr:exosortase system-associated protein, TIGR04073 family [Desulfuromonadaceae bacterium]